MSAVRSAAVCLVCTCVLAFPPGARSQETPGVTVTPGEDLAHRQLVEGTTFAVRFAVTNGGTDRDVFQLTCLGLGAVRCSEVYPTQVAVPPSETVRVTVAVVTQRGGRGLLTLTAFSPTTLTRVAAAQLLEVRPRTAQP